MRQFRRLNNNLQTFSKGIKTETKAFAKKGLNTSGHKDTRPSGFLPYD